MVVEHSHEEIKVEHFPRVITVNGVFPMAVMWHDEEYVSLASELEGNCCSVRQFLSKDPGAPPRVKYIKVLIVMKMLRQRGRVTGDAAFYLIARPILFLAEDFEGVKTLNEEQEQERIYDKLIAGKFLECGEAGMAALYMSDRCEFDRRYENGRRLTSKRRYI